MGDLETPNPWCCPGDGNDETPEEWGADWWRQNKAEIEALIAEVDAATEGENND